MRKRSVFDRLRTAFKAQDAEAFEEELKEAQDEDAPGEPQRLVIEVKQPDPEKAIEEPAKDEGEDPLSEIKAVLTDIAARVAKLEAGEVGETLDEDPKEKEEEKEATMDSAPLRDSFAEVRARAEILSPGINLPVFDAKAVRKSTSKAMHDLRIRALTAAHADPVRKAFVADALGGKTPAFAAMTADSAEVLFNAASALAKAANRSGRPAPTFPQGPMTPARYAELIKQQREKRG